MVHCVGEHKARKGLIRVEFDDEGGLLKNVRITGDFFIHPEETVEDIEATLEGVCRSNVADAIVEFFKARDDVEMPYLSVEDFIKAFEKACGGRGRDAH